MEGDGDTMHMEGERENKQTHGPKRWRNSSTI